MIDDKSFDVWEGYIGKRGTGKSTLALARAFELAKEVGGAIILAQDPQCRVPISWPNGVAVGLSRFASVRDAETAINSGNPPCVLAIGSGRALPVIDLAKRVAKASFDANGGAKGHPCIVVLDEAVNIEGASPHYLSDQMRDLVAGCRHYNVGVIWTSQLPQFLHSQFLALSTRLVLFRVSHANALKNLSAAGVPDPILAKLPSLGKGEHIIFSDL